MRRRKSSNSTSFISVRSCPITTTRPDSGRNSPAASFRRTVLPEPLSPRTTFVSPGTTSNEMPRSTSPSSKEMLTSSKRITGSPRMILLMGWLDIALHSRTRIDYRWKRATEWGKPGTASLGKPVQQELPQKEVTDENRDGCHDDGGRGGTADPLRAATRSQAVVARDRRNDNGENERLSEAHEEVTKGQGVDSAIPEFGGAQAQREMGYDVASNQADEVSYGCEQRQNEHRGDQPRDD